VLLGRRRRLCGPSSVTKWLDTLTLYLTSSLAVEAPVAQRQVMTCRLAHRGCTDGIWSGVRLLALRSKSSCLTKVAASTHSTLRAVARKAGCERRVKSVAMSSSLLVTSTCTLPRDQWLTRLDVHNSYLVAEVGMLLMRTLRVPPSRAPRTPLTHPTPKYPRSRIPFAQGEGLAGPSHR
jgi:hypothetical protein